VEEFVTDLKNPESPKYKSLTIKIVSTVSIDGESAERENQDG
jgi:hypothetical protein